MSRAVRHVRPALAPIALAVLLALGACSTKEAPDDATAATTTLPTGTSVAPTTSLPPSTDTSLGPDGSSSTTTSLEDEGAFGYTPAELEAFRDAYSQAFRAECQRIWAPAGGGSLFDPDFPEDRYGVTDCLAELDPSWGEFADSVDEAQATGREDAQIAASDLADPLCNAGQTYCWSYGD